MSEAAYETHKAQKRARSRQVVAEGNEIGSIPDVVAPERRETCAHSLATFAETYFRQQVGSRERWAPYHFELIERLEAAVKGSQWAAFALPRGGGKSTWCEIALLWAILYGHRHYVFLIAATQRKADDRLRSIRIELCVNELLYEDFPEVAFPISKLERIAQRAKTQTCCGVHTAMEWGSSKLVLPSIAGSVSSGAIVQAAGLTGGDIRGSVHKTEDGRPVRPDLAICDDPQTTESANSFEQTKTRESLISGDVGYLAGPPPNKPISVVMPCTVIVQDDLAERMTDRKRHPRWHGIRHKMLIKPPEDVDLWEQYEEIRRNDFEEGGDGSRATDFYSNNRSDMDDGAEVSWIHRFGDNELSAVQHAMNLKIDDPVAFAAEAQNDPSEAMSTADVLCTPDNLVRKQSGTAKYVVPNGREHLVAYADVQDSLLYYCVIAVDDHMTATVIDYGSYPEQTRSHFRLADAKSTFQNDPAYKSLGGEDAMVFAAVTDLTKRLCERVYTREDGVDMRISRLLFDSANRTETVNLACRKSDYGGIVMPARGIGIGAANVPMDEMPCPKGKGIKRGHHWRTRPTTDRDRLRYLQIDVNYWKTQAHKGLLLGAGAKGCLDLFDAPRQNHRMFAEHCNAEMPIATSGRERELYEWKERPGKPDNHLFDCLVGCLCAASLAGCKYLEGHGAHVSASRKKYRL